MVPDAQGRVLDSGGAGQTARTCRGVTCRSPAAAAESVRTVEENNRSSVLRVFAIAASAKRPLIETGKCPGQGARIRDEHEGNTCNGAAQVRIVVDVVPATFCGPH